MVSISVWQFCLVYVAGASILAVACHKAVTGSFNLVQVTCPPLSAACYSIALFSGYHSIQLPAAHVNLPYQPPPLFLGVSLFLPRVEHPDLHMGDGTRS